MTRRVLLTRILPTVVLVCAGSAPFWIGASGRWLVHDDGAAPADAVLVLAGDYTGRRIRKGTELRRQGVVPVVLVSGPSEHFGRTEDDLAIDFMVREGAHRDWFAGMPNTANSTFEEASLLLPRIRARGVKKLIVVTSDFHTARARRIFRRVAPDLEIRTVAAPDVDYRPDAWWSTRPSRKVFLMEVTKTIADWAGGL